MLSKDKNDAQRALHHRKMRARLKGQIDNSTLHAGSPMYYYCETCGLIADTLPEAWWRTRPQKFCWHCKEDKDLIV